MQLASVLVDFARAFPLIQLDVSFSDRIVHLVDEGFDAAIRIIGQPDESNLIVRRLCNIRLVLAAAPAYLETRGEPVTPTDLAEHDCIIDSNFRDSQIWPFRSGDADTAVLVPATSWLRFASGEACIAAAAAGLGITRVPSFVAGQCFRTGAVRSVLSAFEVEPIGLYALYPPTRHLAVKVRVFVDFLASCYRSGPGWDQGW